MARMVAFLRAINVGGRTVPMKELRRVFEQLGFPGAETFIASGNVLFEAPPGEVRAIERRIAGGLERWLGYEVATFVRTAAEVSAVARYRPFTASQRAAAQALLVIFMAERLGSAGRQALMSLRTDIDDFQVHGREVYWLCLRKQSESKFSSAVFERTLKIRATFRATTTLERLAQAHALAPASDR